MKNPQADGPWVGRWSAGALAVALLAGCTGALSPRADLGRGVDAAASREDSGPTADLGSAPSGDGGGPATDGGPPTMDGGPAAGGSVCDRAWDPGDFARVWEIGPGQAYAEIHDAPWASLAPGTLVRIHWRPEPYRTKWVISTEAREDAPVVVTGVPDGGRLPVISGDGAVTPPGLDFWGEDRSLIKIGGSNAPGGEPGWVYVERLELRDAHPARTFSDDRGQPGVYRDNAASITVEVGHDIVLRGNRIVGSGNGLFTSPPAVDVAIQCNLVEGNGNAGSAFEHNLYLNGRGALVEYNRFRALCPSCLGNNLKSRSSGLVVRYNWIEDGNRQLDLVDAGDEAILARADYADVFVYGNVLVEGPDQGNSQVVHYGGDSGDETRYRDGTLHFFHNTVVSTRTGNTTLFRLSFDDAHADVRNNVFFAQAGGARLAVLVERGSADLRTNWMPAGWRDSFGSLSGTVSTEDNVEGQDPGLVDPASADYRLAGGSPARGIAGPAAGSAGAHPVRRTYVPHRSGAARSSTADAGAFEGE